MRKLKVLVVDDEAFVLKILEEKISQENYEVVTADDGDVAIEKFKEEAPDIVVLDLGLPKIDGYEVLQYMRRETPIEKWQPVLVVSGYAPNTEINKDRLFEPDDYITKPCQAKEIIRKLGRLVEEKIEKRQNEIKSREPYYISSN